jgi:hypothetical protein
MDPFTIMAGIGAVGSLFKGLTGFFGGNAQAQEERNAAEEADRQAGVNAQIALQQGDEAAAHGAVAAAANGGGFVGSAIGVIGNLSNQAMYNARQQVYRGQTEAQNDLYGAAVAKTQAWDSLISGGVGAASSIVGGFAQASLAAQQKAALSALKGDPYAAYGGGY